MGKKLLLINDIAGYGKVALWAMIPVRFPGTGDIFSAVFMGRIMDGESLCHATESAMNVVRKRERRYSRALTWTL